MLKINSLSVAWTMAGRFGILRNAAGVSLKMGSSIINDSPPDIEKLRSGRHYTPPVSFVHITWKLFKKEKNLFCSALREYAPRLLNVVLGRHGRDRLYSKVDGVAD
ncbi:MAG: hypothetical protein COY99_01900 [Candidatus Yonathbacteria bacterium CG_4_10_14_0_8_um_filter_47_645]|uniref:Uncharacterized protein n=2 Tax=Parcubacteria group TaxID=1794811 RepID=A0A1J4V7W6_9BACT|nr:MAG: hypothetical protein AUJ44_03120 [Candidatus Nomurabacteria bacterium CG1_02_47_685]PIP03625.1 MAG: hypothetical protein COX54_02880 [Candidatus Yonathbacteria bacterium CG23_combo_of_CG06-09_8_20_14_all_46_18]PIQ33130.1 MAG: hypothetical protein COW61_00330 [Candidatus Yonathbacteria bacterium CG17_big_fil_post_rev_8_21_14_2_50_46_19]PIY57673.1 MAG: hypothetical protein COY99_01900 [Candidatus Yonathbacteria bacterium CG_4_10_14_0_8_um_filter_47_645]PJC67550.1 MAG: hypothetical protein